MNQERNQVYGRFPGQQNRRDICDMPMQTITEVEKQIRQNDLQNDDNACQFNIQRFYQV